jgi:hypothetical protein
MMSVIRSAGIATMMAAAFCAGTPRGPVAMSSTAVQDAGQTFTMRRLAIPDPKTVDGLRLVERGSELTLLYSTQAASGREHELVIHAAPVAEITRATEVARVGRLLPPPPQWDARPAGGGYELLYEVAGGAVDAIVFQDAQGNTRSVSAEHPFETFSRPRFIEPIAGGASDVSAIAGFKKVVVFHAGTAKQVKYETLADGSDGVVVATPDRSVVVKTTLSGPALFDVLPGRLSLSRSGGRTPAAVTVPDLLAYEFDAAAVGNDIVLVATSMPAVVVSSRRPERAYRLNAENKSWLLQLSRPTVLVTPQSLHLAAIASPGSDQATILYGTVPVAALGY